MLGFTQSPSFPLNNLPKRCIQLSPDTYKSEKPNNFTGIDKIHLMCDCTNGSNVNGVRESILFNFTLDKLPGHKIYKKPRIKHFKILKISVLYPITIFLEDYDHKSVDFNGETKSFTCQLVKVYLFVLYETRHVQTSNYCRRVTNFQN